MSYECLECGMEQWAPVNLGLRVTHADFYPDARFPGRLVLMLEDHYDHLHEVPDELMAEFMRDVKKVSKLLMGLEGVRRVNMAVLGNSVPHVHAHLIPRYPGESLPDKSPWNDPRPFTTILRATQNLVITQLESLAVEYKVLEG